MVRPTETHPHHGLTSRYNPDSKKPTLQLVRCVVCGVDAYVMPRQHLAKAVVQGRRQGVVAREETKCLDCRDTRAPHPLGDARPRAMSRPAAIVRAAYDWLKRNSKCVDCRRYYPPHAIEYDHLPQYEKDVNLSKLRTTSDIGRLVTELQKCEAVCANCHRVRTQGRHEE